MSCEPFPAPSPEVQARGEQTLAEFARAELIEASLKQAIHSTLLTGDCYDNAFTRALTIDSFRYIRMVDFPAVLASRRPSMDWSDPRQDDDSEAA